MADKFEHKDGSFSVFKNTRKEQSTHADLTGSGKFNGQEVWVNLWEKDKNGQRYYSGSIRAKNEAPKKEITRANMKMDETGEIPF